MTESSRGTLRHLLLDGYDDLVRRLAFRLGSTDLAREAMQDTFIRLERDSEIGPVRNPRAYLLRIAFNLATNRRVAENRRLSTTEVEALIDIADETPDPARIAEARSEIDALKRALAELPDRRREITLAAWVEELPHPEIAKRFGVSLRTIQHELKLGMEHCARRLGRNGTKSFASGRPDLSSK
jgi:RNA polymerase sigma-70 factor (ECF subfamily)